MVFAYTVKGRGLPTEGHPANHSALLSGEQFAELSRRVDPALCDLDEELEELPVPREQAHQAAWDSMRIP